MADPRVPDNRPANFPPAGGDGRRPPPVDADQPVEDRSWFASGAVSCGLLGLFIAQIVLCVVTLVLSAAAWRYGEGDPWARKLARYGYGLGVLDGVVWLICESIFHIRLIPF